MLVFKEEPGTSGRARGPDAVEEPDSRGRGDRGVNGRALREEPLIERWAVDADQAAEFDVGQGTPTNQIPKVTLADAAVDREGAEIEELGPGCECCGAAANPSVGRFCKLPFASSLFLGAVHSPNQVRSLDIIRESGF